MIEDVRTLLRVAGALQDALGELDHIAATSPAAVHLQWAIDLIGEQAETLGAVLLPVTPLRAAAR
jgi:hypothetical protein